MKLTEVEIQADGRKATFFYIADDRVDFRELIKIYAKEFRVKGRNAANWRPPEAAQSRWNWKLRPRTVLQHLG